MAYLKTTAIKRTISFLILISVIIIFYYTFTLGNGISERYYFKHRGNIFDSSKNVEVFNIWIIFTKVVDNSPLTFKFYNLMENLLNVTSIPLTFNIIADNNSKLLVENKISYYKTKMNKSIFYKMYDIDVCAKSVEDIMSAMTPYFSFEPGAYYSDVSFYISLGLHRIAPESQNYAILLDCDLYFKKDIALLFNEFKRFKKSALFGLAPELTPVYRHVLHSYRSKHNTTFGDYYHQKPTFFPPQIHPKGFQGYNSGVVLLKLGAIRKSKEFAHTTTPEVLKNMTSTYNFRGHLGDQDLYTLLGYEYPHLIQTLNCGYNRQLCTWWRDHGYSDVFRYYYRCEHETVVLHGNCNTKIPK